MSPVTEHRPWGTVSLTLPFARSSAALARHRLEEWMADAGADADCVDDARLVLTELIGNAVRHAEPLPRGFMLVDWHHVGGMLELSVTDGGSQSVPMQRRAAPESLDGRGLTIVDALAQRWWVEKGPRMSTVRAQLSLGGLAGAVAD